MSARFFSYVPDDGMERHDTEEAAIARVESFLDWARDESQDGGWHEEMEAACWGELRGALRERPGSRMTVEEMGIDEGYEGEELEAYVSSAEFDYVIDYELALLGDK